MMRVTGIGGKTLMIEMLLRERFLLLLSHDPSEEITVMKKVQISGVI